MNFSDRICIRYRLFSNNWEIKLCQEGLGFAVLLAQDGNQTTKRFYVSLEEADRYYAKVCRVLAQAADRAIFASTAKYNTK